jgi:CPA2 family monovalent cation:H+ antiporter-2
MSELSLLQDLVVILAVAVVVVAALQRIGVPSIAGFIMAGALIGPNALALVEDSHQVEVLAEIGVVLLLFGIGLELSLDIMRRLWRPILIGGTLQVGFSILGVVALALLFDLPPGAAVFLGCLVAISSTAVVLGGLRERGELDAPHGRLTLGILVFQDLCVVPMILAIPILAGTSGSVWEPLLAALKAGGVLLGVLVAARLVVPRLLFIIAQTRRRDLFVLSVFLVCAGTAWAVSHAGISLALGAFLAGLVVAGSDYRHQALAELIPLREVLTSIFFVSVGMLLDPLALAEGVGPILAMLVAIVLGKFLVVFLTAAAMRLPVRVCILAGVSLAQGGEFFFVLARAAHGQGLLETTLESNFSIAVILSMLITPVAIALGPHIAAGVGRVRALTRPLGVRTPEDPHVGVRRLKDHVIIAGYGLTGQELARSLRELGVPYVIVDLNAENVRTAIREKEPAFFADVTSPEVLEHLGVHDARELILVINDPGAAVRSIKAVRSIAPQLPILVRARYVSDEEPLRRAGASEVIAAEFEAAVQITTRVLERHQVNRREIEAHLAQIHARHQQAPPQEMRRGEKLER